MNQVKGVIQAHKDAKVANAAAAAEVAEEALWWLTHDELRTGRALHRGWLPLGRG